MTSGRVLVTGAGGFIGAHLVRRLGQDAAEVHALVRRPPRPAIGDVRYHVADLGEPEAVRAVCRTVRPATVFHLAGLVDLARSAEVARACVVDNLTAHVNLLEALRESPPARLVYTSSVEVYGGNPPPFREDQPADPPSPYAITKLAAEQFCRLYGAPAGVAVCVLRLAPGYGPGQGAQRLIPSMIATALRGDALRLRDPGQERDFIYVEDLADAIARAGHASLGPFELVNVGSEETLSLAELARLVLAAVGRPDLAVEHGAEPRAHEARRWGTSAERARRLLDWKPMTDLVTGLARTVQWYRSQP